VINEEGNGWMETHVNRLIDLGAVDIAGSDPCLRKPMRFRCGQTLRFRLCDVYAPGLSDLFNQITPELELQGRISFLSDGGNESNSYAVVEVPGILMPLIVPASAIETVADSETPAAVLA
jgi:hypothetical protein